MKRAFTRYRAFALAAAVCCAGFVGCDSDYKSDTSDIDYAIGSATTVAVNSGSFKDSAVKGVDYVSGKETGTTDADGTFKYEAGGTVTFSVGGVVIGSGSPSGEGAEITPVDIVSGGTEDNQAVVNIARFLQTLDDDGDPTNGIGISKTASDAIKSAGKTIDFDVDATSFSEDASVLEVVQKVAEKTGLEVELVSETLLSTLSVFYFRSRTNFRQIFSFLKIFRKNRK